jgi:hypothetical protein
MSRAVCVTCSRKIDAAAKVCPYCGANPETGEKIDTQALLRESFQARAPRKSEGILEFARRRQGVVIAVVAIVALLILGGLHQFVTMRNATAVSPGPAVPLTDVTDLSNQAKESQPLPMPALKFQYVGNPAAMRTYIVEAGAVTPPEVVAAQQAAAAQKAAQNPGMGAAAPGPHATTPAARPAPNRPKSGPAR